MGKGEREEEKGGGEETCGGKKGKKRATSTEDTSKERLCERRVNAGKILTHRGEQIWVARGGVVGKKFLKRRGKMRGEFRGWSVTVLSRGGGTLKRAEGKSALTQSRIQEGSGAKLESLKAKNRGQERAWFGGQERKRPLMGGTQAGLGTRKFGGNLLREIAGEKEKKAERKN